MKNTDAKKFSQLMLVTGELYGKDVSMALIKLYAQDLAEYSIESIEKAFMKCRTSGDKSGAFFPKPSDLIRFIDGTGSDRALTALSMVRHALKYHGIYDSIKFNDPFIANIIDDCGGWIKFGSADIFETQRLEREFIRRYELYSINPPIENIEYVVGLIEAHNNSGGFVKHIPVTVLIGFENDKKLLN